MKSKSHILCTAALALAALSPAAMAATATGSLAVSATVVDTCDVSATALAFANLGTTAATNEVAPGAIIVTCTSSKTGLTVALNGGGNATGGQRRMSDGNGNFVPYDIHSDSGHNTAIAEDGNIYSGSITAATPTTIDVYGQVPQGAYATGGYTDTVTITVTYN